MSTGDLSGNVQRLVRELRSIKYPGDVDEVGLRLGDPVALLPLLSFTLLKFSRHVARYIVRNGFELAGKTDQRFVETSFRLLRDLLNVRTVLTPAQFFEQGFAERKVLLLCDVITVCKKLHNDEVRHERLAALKATRQEQTISRLMTPHGGQQEPPSGSRHAASRKTPLVKVVRNDDVEVVQVLAPTHQPNASDGAQSVFRTRKTISRSPSPSPSTAAMMGAGTDQSRPRMSPPGRRGAGGVSDVLEVTLRPGSRGAGAQAGRPASVGRQRQQQHHQQQPIHAWFLNPAFDEGVESSVDLGLGLGPGAAGRPDSAAWWQSVPTPAVTQPAAHGWQNNPYLAFARASPPKAAQRAPAGDGGGGRGGAGGAGPAAAWPADQDMGQRDQASPRRPHPHTHNQQHHHHQHHQQPPQHQPQQQQPASSSGAAGGSAAAAAASATGGRDGAYQPREIDEWSFSQYFGPGKGPQSLRTQQQQQQQQQAGGVGTSQDLGGANYGQEYELGDVGAMGRAGGDEQDGYSDAAVSDRDGQEPGQGPAAGQAQQQQQQQQQRGGNALFGWPQQLPAVQVQRASGAASAAAYAAAASAQTRPGAAAGAGAGRGAAGAGEEGAGHGGQGWAVKLQQLEQETQQQVQQLRERLAAAEAELDKCRSEARQTREALQAQVTVLEGRVRFLECEMELCVKRQPTPARTGAAGDGFSSDITLFGANGAAARASPGAGAGRAALSPGREPSPAAAAAGAAAAWRFGAAEPQRPRSAGGTLQQVAGRQPLSTGAADTVGSTGTDSWAAAGYPPAGQVAAGRLRGPAGSPPRPASAEPTSGAAAAAAALARASAEWQRPAASQPAPGAGGTATGAHPSGAAAPSALTAMHAADHGPAATMPHQHQQHQQPPRVQVTLQPPAASSSSLVGSSAGRVTASLTPMPQPSFSFQPSSLMQRVAASAASPPASPGEGPAPAQQEHAPAPAQAHGQRLVSSSVDSAMAGRRYGSGAGAGTAAGALGASQHVRGSVESALPASAPAPAAAAAAVPTAATGSAGGAAGHVPAWRAQPQERAGAAGGRLGAGGAAGGGSILDGISAAGATTAAAPTAAAAPAAAGHHGHATAPQSVSQPAVPAAAAVVAAPAALAPPGGAYTSQPASAGPPPGTGGSAGGGGGAYSSTDDLINSLYMRYTEAQDFLQSIRKR
ncbi:hypothetical protein HXX76_007212 [Chlamydomonas incerta]|uniref:Centrosomal protein of 44 kDa n=1 Tax=Chlamydomonas incerta TaxID=51695 RepID=A0A835SXJ3_CHLIN|nr:hypothetical protein HXX76_007212 [Chlamydomonas incerta]|eukprot:KAG2435127.1 hypothetical protein HXX76_007212 [Chlamydomonas incerta]